jgi:hypothetical protein
MFEAFVQVVRRKGRHPPTLQITEVSSRINGAEDSESERSRRVENQADMHRVCGVQVQVPALAPCCPGLMKGRVPVLKLW